MVQPDALICRFCGHEFERVAKTYVVEEGAVPVIKGDMVPAEDGESLMHTLIVLIIVAVVTVGGILLFVFTVPESVETRHAGSEASLTR